ncbi:DUF2244 domain-containing protein [Methylocella sp.]|uniref:DUF2244 domain-containing protein n=1 Tax=Methylocella sp. TaxID=1978226 RepID=UPI003783CB61
MEREQAGAPGAAPAASPDAAGASPAPICDAALFDARLRPNRSLPASGARLVIFVFALANLALSLPFFLLGAWPVIGFCGLDVALLCIAFRVNFAAARAFEEFRLTFFELVVAKVSARGARREWRFSPAFVRLERETHEEFGVERLALVSRGRSLEVASFLGREEKADFAGALSSALAQARRGPRFS